MHLDQMPILKRPTDVHKSEINIYFSLDCTELLHKTEINLGRTCMQACLAALVWQSWASSTLDVTRVPMNRIL
jgi:hypothetical protein